VSNANAAKAHRSIRFKGRSFIAFVLSAEAPLPDWLASLDQWTRNSPGFFVGRPVVLDLSALSLDTAEIAALVAALAERDIRIVGLEGVAESRLAPTLPPLLKGGRPTESADTNADAAATSNTAAEPVDAGRPAPQSLLIESPIRSGQAVIFPYGDVTVVGSVASGAEIAAGGSIHVYGTLRGRALAGSIGNARARIFCRRNEAELLAIDGYYLTAEAMDATLRGRAVQVTLCDGVLSMTSLD
jgi:septum site-determining protein MinC